MERGLVSARELSQNSMCKHSAHDASGKRGLRRQVLAMRPKTSGERELLTTTTDNNDVGSHGCDLCIVCGRKRESV